MSNMILCLLAQQSNRHTLRRKSFFWAYSAPFLERHTITVKAFALW